jgi:hypothetical protein
LGWALVIVAFGFGIFFDWFDSENLACAAALFILRVAMPSADLGANVLLACPFPTVFIEFLLGFATQQLGSFAFDGQALGVELSPPHSGQVNEPFANGVGLGGSIAGVESKELRDHSRTQVIGDPSAQILGAIILEGIGALDEGLDGLNSGPFGQPITVAALFPERQVRFTDGLAVKFRVHDGGNLGQSAEPFENLSALFAGLEAAVDFFTDMARQPRDLPVPVHIIIFFGLIHFNSLNFA